MNEIKVDSLDIANPLKELNLDRDKVYLFKLVDQSDVLAWAHGTPISREKLDVRIFAMGMWLTPIFHRCLPDCSCCLSNAAWSPEARIRALTDKDFATHMTQMSHDAWTISQGRCPHVPGETHVN